MNYSYSFKLLSQWTSISDPWRRKKKEPSTNHQQSFIRTRGSWEETKNRTRRRLNQNPEIFCVWWKPPRKRSVMTTRDFSSNSARKCISIFVFDIFFLLMNLILINDCWWFEVGSFAVKLISVCFHVHVFSLLQDICDQKTNTEEEKLFTPRVSDYL